MLLLNEKERRVTASAQGQAAGNGNGTGGKDKRQIRWADWWRDGKLNCWHETDDRTREATKATQRR